MSMKLPRLPGLLLSVSLAACTGGASPSPSATSGASPTATASPGATLEPTAGSSPAAIVLRRAPATLGCDTIGVDYRSLTFRIDPAAAEQVAAIADTGAELKTYWSDGFEAGSREERVVRDPDGEVVATDGEVLAVPEGAFPRLHGYFVCPGPEAIYVLLTDPE